jgi:hypothetical protein
MKLSLSQKGGFYQQTESFYVHVSCFQCICVGVTLDRLKEMNGLWCLCTNIAHVLARMQGTDKTYLQPN